MGLAYLGFGGVLAGVVVFGAAASACATDFIADITPSHDKLFFKAEPATSGRDNMKTLALVEDAYESVKVRQRVDVG